MSRTKLPATQIRLSRKLLVYDVLCALVAPVAAYYVREPNFLDFRDVASVALYSGLSACVSVTAFTTFRIAQGLPRYFSFHDALEITKASFFSVAVISAMLFSFTRLDDVPRSVPVIHFLLLAAMLVLGRLARRSLEQRRDLGSSRSPTVAQEEAILLVGANRLAWFYIRILDTFALGHRRVLGLLDTNRKLTGRSMFGHFVLGHPENARLLVADFVSHGIPVSAFVVCEQEMARAHALKEMLQPVADERGIAIEMLAKELGILDNLSPEDLEAEADAVAIETPGAPAYLRVRRVIDASLSGLALALLAPLFVCVALAIAVTLGAPVIFWQRRVGRDGRSIYVYKFRSMRNPVSSRGVPLSDAERASRLGAFLRATRLDELPQLFNVVRGDMAIIGPRPLLPVDQPDRPELRLSVAPGITGWAQIHGGKLVSIDEKNALDEFYVRNASFMLDARIVLKTIKTILRGDRRDASLEEALDAGAFDVADPNPRRAA